LLAGLAPEPRTLPARELARYLEIIKKIPAGWAEIDTEDVEKTRDAAKTAMLTGLGLIEGVDGQKVAVGTHRLIWNLLQTLQAGLKPATVFLDRHDQSSVQAWKPDFVAYSTPHTQNTRAIVSIGDAKKCGGIADSERGLRWILAYISFAFTHVLTHIHNNNHHHHHYNHTFKHTQASC
jgi:hypothetical protein